MLPVSSTLRPMTISPSAAKAPTPSAATSSAARTSTKLPFLKVGMFAISFPFAIN